MPDAVAWGEYDCPDCGESFATETAVAAHQRFHCDGDADTDDEQVWIGARNSSKVDKKHIYHTNGDCPTLARMKKPRKSDLTALNGRWRECQHCQADSPHTNKHTNPESDHELNRAVRDADPEEVFE
jgi:hypothetical protein